MHHRFFFKKNGKIRKRQVFKCLDAKIRKPNTTSLEISRTEKTKTAENKLTIAYDGVRTSS